MYRPKTRGELRDKLQQGVSCEVVTSNVEITTLLLRDWLNFNDFVVEKGQEYSVFVPTTNKEKKEIK